jgi:hypothetical protein
MRALRLVELLLLFLNIRLAVVMLIALLPKLASITRSMTVIIVVLMANVILETMMTALAR